VKTESDINVQFTQSPSGIISGVAIEEDGRIVASFKLKVEGGSNHAKGKSWSSLKLTMISGTLGAKIYDTFDGILSKYGERDMGCQAWRIGHTQCIWRIRDDKVKNAIEEVKKTLQRRKIRSSAQAANNQTARLSPGKLDSGLNKQPEQW